MTMKMKTPAPIWLMVSALSALWGCSSTATGPDMTVPAEWQLVESNCDFLFLVPGEMQKQDVTGIDSCVGQYKGAGMELSYDYGGYSDPLDDYGDSAEYKEESVVINGLQAKLISLRHLEGGELPYFTAAHFPNVGKAGIKLTMSMRCAGPAEVDTARQILHSITFP
jgi:hypothetical protein